MLEQKYNRNLIALLLDKYFIKLHYCSNIFIFLINILVYVHAKNCIVIILILYCNFTALTCIKYFCVCLLDTFQEVCTYCMFVCAYYHL